MKKPLVSKGAFAEEQNLMSGGMNNVTNIIVFLLNLFEYNTSSNFPELLQKDNSVSIQQWHLQLLMSKIYKTNLGLNPCFVKRIFV